MRYLILFLLSFSAHAITDNEFYALMERMQANNATGIFFNTPRNLVASKCRLKLPVKRKQCIAAGVPNTKGGQLEGLPVTGGDPEKYYK